ncbi:unnamed protein product [Mucor hiemalis]
MKFSLLTVATLATAITSAAANFTIIEPWGQSVWTAGQSGAVQWSSTADEAGKMCEIHLLTGNATAATFVANLTANGNLVPCTYTLANLQPLPDFAAGQYSIRFGENGANTDLYAYSGLFQYVGNGSVKPEGSAPAQIAPVQSAPAAVAPAAV